MERNNRILIVDDNKAIHEDIRKILGPSKKKDRVIDELEKALFEEDDECDLTMEKNIFYEIDSAFQGQEALDMVRKAAKTRPYAVLFMDVRMPPGWNGVETILRIWKEFPHTEMVICTAYSDYTWEGIISTIGLTDRLLILKKPFDPMVVKQMCLMLTQKWSSGYLGRQCVKEVEALEQETTKRTQQLKNILKGWRNLQ